MKITDTSISDVKVINPLIYEDERGYFFESFNKKLFDDAVGRVVNFVQDNQSHSRKGVLRGLHFQLPPHAQGKLVRVTCGEIFDVAVDVRKSSNTFGKWVGEILSAENKKQLWIPEGFAHGFLTLSSVTNVIYKTTDYYHPKLESSIRWDDSVISISWPRVDKIILSARDRTANLFSEAQVFE